MIGGLLSVISDGGNSINLAANLSTQRFSSKYGCGGFLGLEVDLCTWRGNYQSGPRNQSVTWRVVVEFVPVVKACLDPSLNPVPQLMG